MAKVDRKENLSTAQKSEKINNNHVEKVNNIKRWIYKPIGAINKEGDILLFRPPHEKPAKYNDIKDSIRELEHRITQAHGISIPLMEEETLDYRGESQKLDAYTFRLSTGLSALLGDVSEKFKNKKLQEVKTIIISMSKARDDKKVKALSLVEAASKSPSRLAQIRYLSLARTELDERKIEVDNSASRALETRHLLIQMKTQADNLFQQTRLKIAEYAERTDRNEGLSPAQLTELEIIFTQKGKLGKLFAIDFQPYKKRIESTEIRKLKKLPEILQEIPKKTYGDIFGPILIALDSEIKKSLGDKGYKTFLESMQPLKEES